ncbi:DMT family transporter [Orrella sp. NBD-18]|uniref:DMT family transporter n=2 Tax=Sheuella amnicola TaxID=2707330 RepID=A0A6B2QX19_9BURK|nr:DMT family transporter [Sheuella amnicola]HBI84531.1 EamA family transporter [Alcaligenaceae bacterium]
MLLGLWAVALFSLTLPATRLALESFDPLFVATGRASLAALLAAMFLILGKHRFPNPSELKYLLLVILGVGFGFPIFTALAMKHVDASHGGVMLGIMPLTTAAAGALLFKERPSIGFWVMALIGSALVIAFSLIRGSGALQWADLALLLAVVTGSIAYATGGFLSKTLGGLQVISWALVIASPVLVVIATMYAPDFSHVTIRGWTGFVYAALISQYLGFLPWFKGMALGGIARVGQTQLVQPFLTLIASAMLLGENLDTMTLAFAILVFFVVAAGRKFGVKR